MATRHPFFTSFCSRLDILRKTRVRVSTVSFYTETGRFTLPGGPPLPEINQLIVAVDVDGDVD